MKVVSLVPSATETLLAWGITPVACTRFCEQPNLVHVGGTKDPDIAAIVAIEPDVVIMDEEENNRPDAEALVACGLTVLALSVRSLAGMPRQLERLAEAVDFCGALPSLPPVRATTGLPRTRVITLIWKRPWMAIGADTYGSTVLDYLGWSNALPAAPRYPELSLRQIAELQPDMVLLATEPYRFADRHVAEISAEMPNATVRLVDGQDLFWWGARTPLALARLEESLLL